MSLFETKRELYKYDLTFVVIDSASFNPDYPPKSVIEQNPEPGDFVKKNRKIYLTLNPSDYRKIEVPEVLDQTKRQVVTRLKSAGFRIGKERFIPDLGKNVVRMLEMKGKELKPGKKISKNSIIDLVLGDGLEGKQMDSIVKLDIVPNG
jgi:beta-lactam-binding protein with PASTA domain